MRKAVRIFGAVLLVLVMSAVISVSAAEKEAAQPRLKAISFKNAVLDGEFSSDVMSYTITLEDNSVSPTLESYRLEGDCHLFIGYIYSETKQQLGITATVEYPTGSMIYTFTYSNPAEYERNSNNLLAQLDYNYGELEPELNENDTEYTLYIPSDLTRLLIYPVTMDTNAHCSQSPVDITLSEGQEFSATIDCTASDGSVRQYTIDIVRVEKTIAELEQEMLEDGSASLVKGTRFYEKKEFFIVLFSVVTGIAILVLLYKMTRRVALNPYDKDEPEFFD